MKENTTRAKSINDYIKKYPKPIADRLSILKKIVHTLAPEAEEVISYGMPAFKQGGIILYFAAFKSHIGLYPYPSSIKKFAKEAKGYKTSAGTIQLPHDRPLPIPLIKKIIAYRVKEKLSSISKPKATKSKKKK